MSDNNDFLLKYFFIYGVQEETKKNYKQNPIPENNKINPVVLSSYSTEGKTELFESVKELLKEDIYLQQNIFPKKADFLSNVVFDSNPLEPPTLSLTSNPFNQYIYTVRYFSQVPDYFSHCFQYIFKLDENNEENIILNFSVLIFFENVTYERDLLDEKNNKSVLGTLFSSSSKYYNTYIGKAIILVSEKPIFSLMNELLEYIYNKYITKKYTFFPIEEIIINFIDKINNDNNDENNNTQIKKYRLFKEPILPYCDFNISFFFQIFNLDDIFLIAEYYLCSKNIIIVCSNADYLFPIYYILMTLFFPLNKNSNERFYKLLVPDEQNLQRTIFGMLPTFQFIYNDEELDIEIIKKICQIKEDILIYHIHKDAKENIIVNKKILTYKDKIIEIDVTKYKNIIRKVFIFNIDIYNDLISFLINDIKEISKYFDKAKKKHSFFDFSFDTNIYDSLRNHFIGLFIKFFVICLNPIKFNLKDNKIEIDLIDFKRFNDDTNANDLLSTLYTTPQSDLIYKNEIIKNGKFDNKVLKKIILLDYFLKISSIDKDRSYFEPKYSKDVENNIIKKNNFNLEDLFNYKILLDGQKNIFYYLNRLYLYPLESSKKADFIINQAKFFINDIEYYQELTKKDRTKELEDIIKRYALDYVIFFGENFNLHFGQFINKNLKILFNQNDNINGNLDRPNKESLKNIANYEKYYKSTLDEAEIFYDLFITQIIMSENRKQLASCAIGLFVSIYIINLLSEINEDNNNNDKILEIIYKNSVKLYELFNKTNCFYGKYDFLITLLFEIVSSFKYKKDFTESLIRKLEENKILPSIIVILMYNHKISLNFGTIKKNIENKNEINNINKMEQRKSFNEYINPKGGINNILKELKNKLNISTFEKKTEIKINEILISYIQRNEHEHKYNIIDGINNDYNCENKNCTDILNFTIQKTKNGEKDIYFIYNPRYIIIKLLQEILDKNSLFICPYNDVNDDDIFQIAMLDELYFQIGFFKEDQKEQENPIE